MSKNNAFKNYASVNFIPLCGNYTASGNNYYSSDTAGALFKVCKRKQPTDKPELYLMRRSAQGKFVYFSSLYPRSGNTYTAEQQHRYYIVTLTDKELIVSPLNQNA